MDPSSLFRNRLEVEIASTILGVLIGSSPEKFLMEILNGIIVPCIPYSPRDTEEKVKYSC